MQPDMPKRYDDFTLREPLCNCIAHQLWTAGARIEVVEFEDDRLIFQNYGPFIPTSVMQVVMNDSPSSYYLNPFLVEAMRNVDLIDTEGGGIKHLFELQRERMFPMPEYDINDGKVKLTITGHVDNKAYADLLVERPELTLEEVMHLDYIAKRHPERLTSAQIEKLVEKGLIVKQGQDYIISMEGTSKSVLDDLNDRQKDALTFFKGKISSSDYANRYGVSTKTAKRDLSDMSDKKLIDIEGDRKTSRYIFAQ
jgi:ATP-dependent DNA helicase RecG